ncbi:hypothetical protein PGB34_19030 [Xenophilus arseniciresistens]|uniref:Lipoprotein transmembrane n=1 Tax=Xenophilus arseniciresistens TaxID=1283306 RepID=A0AAE3NF50_9BURK|nr:hypothetical protein [Xenophilus arseniciresistens]MDA7418469.1 hypothetical protein [Xenophilus arseniciresistens]
MKKSLPAAAATLGLLLLAGCVSEPTWIAPGTSRAETLQRLGPPTASYALAQGERLQYSRQPMGFEVSNVDLDAQGRVVSVTQVMDEGRFAHDIRVDEWRVPDVLRTYGRPEEISRVSSFNGDVWQWRYRQLNNPRLLYIYLDPQGVVRRYHVGDDLRFVPPNSRP